MPEWLLILAGQVFTAGAIYAGIKADIRHANYKAEQAHVSADAAHTRIDNLLLRG